MLTAIYIITVSQLPFCDWKHSGMQLSTEDGATVWECEMPEGQWLVIKGGTHE